MSASSPRFKRVGYLMLHDAAPHRDEILTFDGETNDPAVRSLTEEEYARASGDDEDEGQPAASEIFTEEDVEALGAVEAGAQSEEDAGDENDRDPEPLQESADAAPEGLAVAADGGDVLYPGIAILPDELGARRNAVLAAIATEKLTRLKIATDPSRAAFLAERFAEYQNRGALSLEIDDMLLADYRAYLAMKDRQERITNYAMQLEQSALDGDMDRLEAMHAGLGDGWP